MMMYYELEQRLNDLAADFLPEEETLETNAESCGLDPRSCYGPVWVRPDFIAVQADYDHALRYYGGFEYVESELRVQVGGMVFYFHENENCASERVCRAIQTALGNDVEQRVTTSIANNQTEVLK